MMLIPKFQNKVPNFTFVTVPDFTLQINFFFVNDIF